MIVPEVEADALAKTRDTGMSSLHSKGRGSCGRGNGSCGMGRFT